MAEAAVPSYYDLLWPTLQAVIVMDGSGRIDEINRRVIEREGYSEQQRRSCTGTVRRRRSSTDLPGLGPTSRAWDSRTTAPAVFGR
jgi:hypothetical protein